MDSSYIHEDFRNWISFHRKFTMVQSLSRIEIQEITQIFQDKYGRGMTVDDWDRYFDRAACDLHTGARGSWGNDPDDIILAAHQIRPKEVA